MAVAHNITTNYATSTADTSHNWNHNATDSTNGFLWIGINANKSSATIDVSAITHDGNDISGNLVAGPVRNGRVNLWVYYVKNPGTGSKNIAVTLDESAGMCACSISYTGVDQTTPYDGEGSNTASGTSISDSVTSASGELVVDFFGETDSEDRGGGPVIAPDGSQTERGRADDGVNFYAGTSEKAGAASVTMQWTSSIGNGLAIIDASLNPAATATVWTMAFV